MEDERIIDLYWQRSQEAISRTDEKYGRLCTKISLNILFQGERPQHLPHGNSHPHAAQKWRRTLRPRG